ncbi:MAG: hypothetical protein GF313_13550 [Caldithrix sp.]|nr:hypothetical protein [Caldithrix sp.]
MKRYILISIILALALSVQLSIAAKPIAVIIKAKGESSIDRSSESKKQTIKLGMRLFHGDKIQTGKKGFVALKFVDDGSLVRVRSNSSLSIEGEEEEKSIVKNILMEFGSIFSRITKKRSEFRVTTPTSVASVKGTAFWTVQEFKGATRYFGEEGVVEISNESGSALLKEGETGIVTSSNSKPIVRKTQPGEKPKKSADDSSIDEFQFEIEDEEGNTQDLKFKVKEKTN